MKVKCPTCGRETPWENNVYRPFCSDRCKTTDLGEWAMGKRSIPSDHGQNGDEGDEKPSSEGKPGPEDDEKNS